MGDTPLFIPVLNERGKWNDYRMGVWGNSFTWYRERPWNAVKHVVIHHSVTTPTDDPKGDVDYIAELHRQRGWDGVGYHFIITADGTVWYVGDISLQRANVADKNDIVIGVCLVGDFTKGNPTDEQILSAHDLSKYLIFDMPQLTSCNNWADGLKGHKDLQATQCPGSSWDSVEGGSMRWRIETRTPYTPQPVPPPTIDWEKSYYELKATCETKVATLEDAKKTCLNDKSQLETQLANCDAECQRKIQAVEENCRLQIIEEAKKYVLDKFETKALLAELLRRIKWSRK